MTKRERELLASDDPDEDEYRYQAASRIRKKIKDELTEDMEILGEYHPTLLQERREIVCDDEPEGVEALSDEQIEDVREKLRRASVMEDRTPRYANDLRSEACEMVPGADDWEDVRDALPNANASASEH